MGFDDAGARVHLCRARARVRHRPHRRATRPGAGLATASIVLPLVADTAGLERFAAAVSTPGSPDYGRYAPIARLSRWFGASARARRA